MIEGEIWLAPRAVCRLTAGEARSISGIRLPSETVVTLEIVQDKPTHANLIGLPEVLEEPVTTERGRQATADAEFIGGELAARVRIVWRKPAR